MGVIRKIGQKEVYHVTSKITGRHCDILEGQSSFVMEGQKIDNYGAIFRSG
jgi:hypothetical protein